MNNDNINFMKTILLADYLKRIIYRQTEISILSGNDLQTVAFPPGPYKRDAEAVAFPPGPYKRDAEAVAFPPEP
ncbi:hypothetical protein Glove_195g18 [Diversispora epigaea]|uniref:Uncharacterized protein n=1 Tax=Diversispora epigaea TaxID=1348612 RepID=A0A397IKT1_9GLOM|nr:hypothetical protein Glove_195g18 [Diversispora epigaea]